MTNLSVARLVKLSIAGVNNRKGISIGRSVLLKSKKRGGRMFILGGIYEDHILWCHFVYEVGMRQDWPERVGAGLAIIVFIEFL